VNGRRRGQMIKNSEKVGKIEPKIGRRTRGGIIR